MTPVNLPFAKDPTGGVWDFLTQEQLDAIWSHASKSSSVAALIDEISDFGVQNCPLAGCDVLDMMVKHGIATAEQVQAGYNQAYVRHGHKEWVRPGHEVKHTLIAPSTP